MRVNSYMSISTDIDRFLFLSPASSFSFSDYFFIIMIIVIYETQYRLKGSSEHDDEYRVFMLMPCDGSHVTTSFIRRETLHVSCLIAGEERNSRQISSISDGYTRGRAGQGPGHTSSRRACSFIIYATGHETGFPLV